MLLTLVYQGYLPAKRTGVSEAKHALREQFHPQLVAQLEGRVTDDMVARHSRTLSGISYFAPVHQGLSTAVELDVLMLTSSHLDNVGDADNRLKNLMDGLTRPANAEQASGASAPSDGGPAYCLMDDDRLVSRIGLDVRAWVTGEQRAKSIVVVSARIVLGSNASLEDRVDNVMLVL
jgi:hypothetical protein